MGRGAPEMTAWGLADNDIEQSAIRKLDLLAPWPLPYPSTPYRAAV
jgi:hypothetical protein